MTIPHDASAPSRQKRQPAGRWLATAGIALCLLWPVTGGSAAAEPANDGAAEADEGQVISFSGFAKNFLLGIRPATGRFDTASGLGWMEFADARFNALWRPAQKITVGVAYEVNASIGEFGSALGQILPPISAYRIADLNPIYAVPGAPPGHFSVNQNLDRAYVSGAFGVGDLTLGRQPVAFGSAKVVNPTDVLAPFSFQTLDKEERPGVDALRLRVPWGAMGELDTGWVAGRNGRPEENAYFLKPKIYIWETDLTGLIMRFRDQALAGLDLARAVGGASVWLETAYVWAGAFAAERLPEQDYFRLSAGADYNLADGLYGFVEYHYNGAGTAQREEYLLQGARTAYASGAVYLLGKHYLAPGLNYQVTPLLSLAVQALINLTDPSAFLSPALEYSFADNVSLELGAFLAMGETAVLPVSGSLASEPKSEFGLYPTLYFISAKLYF
jgi:hypothetical protein